MPLIRGGSVAGLVGDFGALPVPWVAELLDQTLRALTAVHEAGYVHRDVKPANLLLDATGAELPHLHLSDFGIAAPLDEPRLTRASQVIGSPGYLAPEQLRGADPDPRQDVYGAAMVGLELLTGLRPPQCLDAARDRDDALTALLLTATSDAPDDRPATIAELRRRLRALDLPPFATPADPDGPFVFDHFAEAPPQVDPVAAEPARTDRRRQAGAALLAVALLCLIAAAVVLIR